MMGMIIITSDPTVTTEVTWVRGHRRGRGRGHCQLSLSLLGGSVVFGTLAELHLSQTTKMKLIDFLVRLVEKRSKKMHKKRTVLTKKHPNSFRDPVPVFTSTPPSFKIHPLNQCENKCSEFQEEDFKIYDNIEPLSVFYNDTPPCSSTWAGEAIYENLSDLIEGSNEKVFENVCFLNSLEFPSIPSEDVYEIIHCKNQNEYHYNQEMKFRPRTLKNRRFEAYC